MKTFIAAAVDASAVQQALSGLRTPVPLNHIPRDEQVLFQSNILGPVRILITANLYLDIHEGILECILYTCIWPASRISLLVAKYFF